MTKRSLFVSIATLAIVGAMAMVVRSARGVTPDSRQVTAPLTAHSYLYGAYENAGPKLGEGHDTTAIQSRHTQPQPLSVSEFAAKHACRADLVIAGRVVDSASALTAGGHFIFTDYEVSVDDVVKQNLDANLVTGDRIIITRPGGHIQVGSQHLQAFHEGFPLLEVGSSYLLFLHFLPDTRSYQSTDVEGTFALDGAHARHIANFPIAIDVAVDRRVFVTAVRNVAFAPCI